VFGDLAVHGPATLVTQLLPDRAFEEALAALAADRPVVPP